MEYLRVKNWGEFQHYKDRLPPWIKLHRALLTDYDFCHLPDETKGHLLMAWLLASQMDGRLPDDARWIAARIGANKPVNLALLIETGWLVREEEAAQEQKRATKAESIGWGSRHISDHVKREVWARDDGKCRNCAASEHIEYDHVTPVSRGGASTADNLQLLCRSCNRKKRVALAVPAEHQPLRMRSLETETYKSTEAETQNPSAQAREEVPPWLPAEAWTDFVDYRRKQKGWTSKAEALLLRELDKLRSQGNDPVRVLEQSIANGWKGLFPLRGEREMSRSERRARNMDILTGRASNERTIEGIAERVGGAVVLALPGDLREQSGDDVGRREHGRGAGGMG